MRRVNACAFVALLAVLVAASARAQEGAEMDLLDPSAPDVGAGFSVVNDDVMGGRSSSEVAIEGGAVVFAGTVRLDDGGGFASMRAELEETDLRRFEGIELVVRGDGRRYKLHLRDAVGREDVRYQASFETRSGERRTVRLPFVRFEPRRRGRPVPGAPPLDLGRIRQLGVLVSDRQAGDFRIELHSVRAYRDSSRE